MSDHANPGSAPSVITLSKEELTGEHVDNLLKRQMNLRGDPSVTRSRRRWYYQNWFVFLMAASVAALLAWAIVEPFFDDMHYVQGAITNLDLGAVMPQRLDAGNQYVEIKAPGQGRFEIRGQTIWLLRGIKELNPDGSVTAADITTLREGQVVGVHVQLLEAPGELLALGAYLCSRPPDPPPAKGLLPLERQNARSNAAGLLLFPVVAGLVGLALGAADGFVCRLMRRALLGGLIGFLVGFVGGFISANLAGLIYLPLNKLAMQEMSAAGSPLSPFGFFIQMIGRTLAWGMAGMAMGLGQGIALRSKRLLLYGFLGGLIGGLLGGLLFDPVDLILLGVDKPSAHWSRLIGMLVVGASVGTMIGVVELLARDAWLRMVEGPLAGKEFLIFRDTMTLGSSPRSDLYLFNDEGVAAHHATLRAIGDDCEIENHQKERPLLLNSRPVQRARLRHGDRLTLGRTVFVFEKRQG